MKEEKKQKEKKGFFARLFNKIDKTMESKAKSGGGCCCCSEESPGRNSKDDSCC